MTCEMKCVNHWQNLSVSIHPLSVQVTRLPLGAPSLNCGGNRFLRKMIMGGTYCEPEAFTQQATVVVTPLSALDTVPNCFLPLWPKTFWHFFWTVVIPLSSTLKILLAVRLWFLIMSSRRSKYLETASLLKPLARDREVASGCRRLMSGNLFRNR